MGKNKEYRNLKVYEQTSYNFYGHRYTSTPTIVLKGQWLRELGFEKGEKIVVHCEDGKLTISKDEAICYDDVQKDCLGMVAETEIDFK